MENINQKEQDKEPVRIEWIQGSMLILLHLVVATGLFFYFKAGLSPSKGVIASSILLYVLTALGITTGYHRLFSHPTFKAHPVVESLLLFFGGISFQGSALRWSHDHRNHHAFVDTEKDPYSIQEGFWHAHVLWMFKKMQRSGAKVISDLLRNPRVMFQHHYYLWVLFGGNALVGLLFGWILGDYTSSFLFVVGVRLVLWLHCTWFINSLAHMWGSKTYSDEHSAVDNFILAVLTMGEGYHNYHHSFANDYRNGVRWFHFDPSKWLIWALSKCGLAHGLNRTPSVRIAEKLITHDRQFLLEQLQTKIVAQKDVLEARIIKTADRLIAKLKEFNTFRKEFSAKRKNREIQERFRLYKRELRQEWKELRAVSKEVMKLKEA